jgi:hypothetical protein
MATPNIGNDLELANLDYQRKQALADALRKQSQEVSQGQMIGNRYVAPSWTQGLNKALQGYYAGELGNKNIDQLREARQAYDTRGQGEMQNFMSAMRGTPASESQNVAPDEYGQMTNQPIQNPAQAPDQAKALALALQSKNPMLQTVGATLLNREFTPKEPKWEKASIHNADGSITHGYADMNSKTPESTFRPLGGSAEKVKGAVINGQLVNPLTATPIGAPIPEQANPFKDLVVPNPLGGVMPNAPLIEARKSISKEGATKVSLNVDTAPKALATELGKDVAKTIGEARDKAESANQTLANVQQMRAGLGKAITGPFANQRITLNQIGETLGVTGKDTAEQLQNTRNVIQGLARQELAAAGQMKGQGQITESERGILRRAESGSINELTKPELETLFSALEKTAKYRIGMHEANMQKLSGDKNLADVSKYYQIPPMTRDLSPTKANAAKQGGAKFLGFE